MSSYYPSFNYKGFNSLKDKKLIVVAFDPDQGEVDTFLGMDCIYTDKYDGTRRLDYGAKFNSVAVIKISVMKANEKDFTVAEVRDFLRWTTGSRTNSYLDLMVGNEIKFSFLGRVTNAYQQKLDSRTVGLSIEFTSVGPWAYSPIQRVGYSSDQSISIDSSGIVCADGGASQFSIDNNGVLSHSSVLSITNDGVVYIDNSPNFEINNETDDLYTPVYLNTIFTNGTSTTLSIKNVTLNEETTISNIRQNETITLSAEQFIISDAPSRIFGSDFNFIWPRLASGINKFVITTDGNGSVEFTYRYPIKIGDCAIDIDALNNMCGDYVDEDIPDDNAQSGGNSSSGNNGSSGGGTVTGPVSWSDILNKPTTISGYKITDAYTKSQVDQKIADAECTCDGGANVDEKELNDMLESILGE